MTRLLEPRFLNGKNQQYYWSPSDAVQSCSLVIPRQELDVSITQLIQRAKIRMFFVQFFWPVRIQH